MDDAIKQLQKTTAASDIVCSQEKALLFFIELPTVSGEEATAKISNLPDGALPSGIHSGSLGLMKHEGEWMIESFSCS